MPFGLALPVSLRGPQIRQRGRRRQPLQLLHPALPQTTPDCGRADNPAVPLLAGDDDAGNPCFRKLRSHYRIVQVCHLTDRLLPHVPPCHTQRLGNPAEHRQVQPRLSLCRSRRVRQKIAWEGGSADDIWPALMTHHIGQMGSPLLRQTPADCKGEFAGILADHKDMDSVVF